MNKLITLILLISLTLTSIISVNAQVEDNQTVVIEKFKYTCFIGLQPVEDRLLEEYKTKCKSQGFRYVLLDKTYYDCTDLKTYAQIYPTSTVSEYSSVYNQCVFLQQIPADVFHLQEQNYPSDLILPSAIVDATKNNKLLGTLTTKYTVNPSLSREENKSLNPITSTTNTPTDWLFRIILGLIGLIILALLAYIYIQFRKSKKK
jgi:hypothetical protein